MHQAEIRALRRATLLLFAISLVRWGWSSRDPPAAESGSVLPELLEESRAALDEGEHRAAPLSSGERVDLNRAGEVDLDRLPGIGPATARAIVDAREAGAVFRAPEDLMAVKGIGSATIARIRDVVTVDDPPVPAPAAGRGRGGGRRPGASRIDVNRAGTEELQALPGVGPALAERIVEARQERLFSSLDDLERVPGIGSATVRRLRDRATVGRGR